MNRRIMAVATAAMILAALWFPAQTVYASDLETDVDTMRIGVSAGPDGEAESEPEQEDVFPLGFSLGGEDTVKTDIIEVYKANLDNPEDAYFLETGGDARTLSLADTAWAQYERFRSVECEIGWRYDEFDSITPGRRMITGDILLPEGYAFQDEPLTVQSPVIVYDPDSPPTETVENCGYTKTGLTRFLIPLGTERDALPDYFSDLADRASIKTDNGDEFYCPLTLDLDAIDTNTAGVYYPIVLDLPSCVTLDERKFYILGVHVLPVDEVDLRAVTYWRIGYLVSWLYPIQAEPETILRVSVDRGDWFQCTTDYYSNEYVDYFNVAQNSFTEMIIKYEALSDGHTYEFQLQYEGDRFSNILEIDLVNNSLPHVKGGGGDRKGYDRDPEGPEPPEDDDYGGQGGNEDPPGSNDDNGEPGGNEDPPGGNDDNGSGNSDPEDQGEGDNGNEQGDDTNPSGDGEAGNNTGGGRSSSGSGRTGNGSPDPDIVTQISTVAAEGSPPVTPLDMAANLPSGSLQEPQNTGPIAPASNGLDGDSSGLRDEDQSARHVAAQDIVPDKLPDIPAAQTDEPQMPATLPSALPLSLGGVAGLSCAGLVLLKKWRFAR